MKISQYLATHRLITDGAMGTYFEQLYQSGGVFLTEKANLTEPEKVKAIHEAYIRSGAKLIRSNTFAANTMFLDTMEEVQQVITAGYKIAAQAAEQERRRSGSEIYVAADIGPVIDVDFCGPEAVRSEYKQICDMFLSCGAEIFLFETQGELNDIEEVTSYIKEKKDVFILVQFSVDKSGTTKSGVSVERIVNTMAAMDTVDAYGFNCGVGAAHLYQLLQQVEFPNDKYITALPNAGYPVELRGHILYAENEAYFVERMKQIAELGVNIMGGCCGTSPDYIKRLTEEIGTERPKEKRIRKQTPQLDHKGIEEAKQKEKRTAFSLKLETYSSKRQKGVISPKEMPMIVELDPPFGADISKVRAAAEIIKASEADLITISDSPLARPRLDAGKLAAKLQRELDIPVMPHVSCRDKNVIGMRSSFLGDYMNELRHFLVVTGDPVPVEARNTVKSVFNFNSIRLMQYLQEMNQEDFKESPVFYGGALNYHGANPDAIIARMEQKMERGCQCFLTQPIYCKEDVERIAYIKERCDARIMCGIMPLVNYKNAVFMANEMPGIHIPKETVARYDSNMTREEAEEVAVLVSVEIAEKLLPYADGFYFMTPFNRAGLVAGIMKAIRNIEVEKDI